MSVAVLFPGQGVAIGELVLEWGECSCRVKEQLGTAAQALGIPVEAVFGRGGRRLKEADVLEPVQTALMVGIHEELLARGVRPDIVAGHSLGELAAGAAAGYFDPADAIRLAVERGRVMHREGLRHPGGMVAISAADWDEAKAAALAGAPHGMVTVAAHNTPDQWLISGEWAALRVVAARCGAVPLAVAGAWHSPAMAGAVAEFRDAAAAVTRPSARVPFVSNRTGRIVTDAADIPMLLSEMLTHPVLWVDVMATLLASGVRDAIIVAPTRVLAALVRLNLGTRVRIRAVESPGDLSLHAAELTA